MIQYHSHSNYKNHKNKAITYGQTICNSLIPTCSRDKYGVRFGGKIHNNLPNDNLSTPLLFHKENNTKGKT